MPIDLLGPAAFGAERAATSRPAFTPTSTEGALDTFAKNCTHPLANDGTEIDAAWMNALLEQIRHTIRAAKITENNADDDMLLKAVQQLAGRRSAQVFTAGQVLSGVTPVAATEYTVQTLTVTGASSLIIYGGFMLQIVAALQADCAPRIRVTRLGTPDTLIDEALHPGVIIGQSYSGEATIVNAFSVVDGLDPALSYRVDLIVVCGGNCGNLRFHNPRIEIAR